MVQQFLMKISFLCFKGILMKYFDLDLSRNAVNIYLHTSLEILLYNSKESKVQGMFKWSLKTLRILNRSCNHDYIAILNSLFNLQMKNDSFTVKVTCKNDFCDMKWKFNVSMLYDKRFLSSAANRVKNIRSFEKLS